MSWGAEVPPSPSETCASAGGDDGWELELEPEDEADDGDDADDNGDDDDDAGDDFGDDALAPSATLGAGDAKPMLLPEKSCSVLLSSKSLSLLAASHCL